MEALGLETHVVPKRGTHCEMLACGFSGARLSKAHTSEGREGRFFLKGFTLN